MGALGVVFGDIGTSPIYTLRECPKAAGGGNATDIVLGLLSLLFWALMIVVTAKYVLSSCAPTMMARAGSWRFSACCEQRER